jgi:hypothetical protein
MDLTTQKATGLERTLFPNKGIAVGTIAAFMVSDNIQKIIFRN